jgi:hypothetical protein
MRRNIIHPYFFLVYLSYLMYSLQMYCVPAQPSKSTLDFDTKHTDAIPDDCPEKPAENDYEKIVDDIIETMEQAFFRICSMLSHCNKNGMVFSPDKFMFAKETVEFAGFEITKELPNTHQY